MKKNKLLALLLVVVMGASLLSCASDEPASTPGPAAEDAGSTPSTDTPNTDDASATGITLNVLQWEPENQTIDFENLWFYEELEKDTGIKINWTVVKESEWNTNMNLMFVSGNYPDLIIRPNLNLSVEEYGVTQGILIPLDDYINADVMPNYYSRLHMNDANAAIPASDGLSYYIGYLVAQNINHDGNFYINKMWLDTLGLDIPTTLDELTQVLIAFRDEIPAALGMDTVYPFSAGGNGGAEGGLNHQTNGLYVHFAMFGVPLQRWIHAAIDDNHQVVFPGFMPGFREAVEWLHMCYDEGLLDPEALTQDTNEWNVKMNQGQIGFTSHLRLINAGVDEVRDDFVSILPPTDNHGASVPRVMEIPDFGAVVTVANQHVEETMRWLDAQFETERMMVASNGPLTDVGTIGATLMINEEGKYEVIYVPDDNALYNYVPLISGQFFAPGDYYFDIFEMPPHRVERYESSKEYAEAGVLETNSHDILRKLVILDADDAATTARLHDSIQTLLLESLADFITRGVTDSGWDTFESNVINAGIENYLSIYQAAYDAYRALNP